MIRYITLFYLNPKFQASSHLLWLYSPVCVRPGRKPRRPVFSERGSFIFAKFDDSSHALCFLVTLACLSGPWSLTHLRWAFARCASFVHVLIENKKTKMKTTSIFDCKLSIANCQSAILFTVKKQNDNAPMQCIAIFNSCKMNKM